MAAIEPRAYQRASVDAVYQFWIDGEGDHPLIVAPTGSGKSIILAMLCSEAMQWEGTRVCVLVHVKELVEQNVRAIMRMTDERVGIYCAALNSREHHHPITVASIQSIYRRAPDADPWDIVIVDEAHRISPRDGTQYRRFLEEARLQNPQLKIVGLTATPYRMGSGRLDEGPDALFDAIAYEITIPELLEAGHLCEIVSVGGLKKIDVFGVKVRGGDYVARDLARAADDPEITKAAVAEIVRYGENRNGWLIFTAGVQHGEHVLEEIRSHGISAAMVTGKTPADEREHIVREYKAGRVRCVVNVEVFTTGFDAPHTDLIAALRPTKSPVLYVQAVGRGMRPHPNKENCLLLDFSGWVMEHGPVDAVNVRAPGSREPGEAPAKECPNCRMLLHTAVRDCPGCGYEWPPPSVDDKLTRQAFGGAVLSHQRTQEIVDVTGMQLSKWEPVNPDRPNTLLVTYYTGLRDVREWLCPEHPPGSYARRMFEHRCRTEWGIEPPATIAETIAMRDRIREPAAILVKPSKENPKYLDVIRRFYPERESNAAD